jgi:nucleotide-binding universal stress UspA family protein
MYQKILVPLDGSARAEAIFPHVESLAHKMAAALILLQVVDPIMGAAGLDGLSPIVLNELIDREAEAAGTYLEHKRSVLADKGIAVTSVMRYGAVVPTIIEVAEEQDADLIALASHGRTGLARLFYGSVAAGIVQRADRPLLIIRAAN